MLSMPGGVGPMGGAWQCLVLVDLDAEHAVAGFRVDAAGTVHEGADGFFGADDEAPGPTFRYASRDARREYLAVWSDSQTETGFRMLKISLGLRSNFHLIEERVDGHSLPDAARQEVYHRLGIDWRRAFETVKTGVKGQ